MNHKSFKLSALAASLLVATGANAALYTISEVSIAGNEGYGVAIAEQSESDCFDSAATCNATSAKTGGESRQGSDGFPFKDEAPFAYDNQFIILDRDDLESYCDDELGYQTCENWAYTRWFGNSGQGGLQNERDAYYDGYTSNAKAYVDGSRIFESAPTDESTVTDGTFVANSTNVVITKFSVDATPVEIGTTSSGYYEVNGTYRQAYRERGFYDTAVLLPAQTAGVVQDMGRSMAFDSFRYDDGSGIKTYVVGSASTNLYDTSDSSKDYAGDVSACDTNVTGVAATLRACQHVAFATKPYYWNVDSAGATVTGNSAADWENSESANYEEYAQMASIRGAAIANNTSTTYEGFPVLVGYNSVRPDGDSNLGMQAGVFYPKTTVVGDFQTSLTNGEEAWNFTSISGATIHDGDDYIFSNSRATDINSNLVVIGEAKLRNGRTLNGALANRLFWSDASNGGTPSANYFTGGIFFNGAGGNANAINTYNIVVGKIDAESVREDGGRQRRTRGFIYPLGDVNGATDSAEISARRAIFGNQAWWLDDLTNSNDAVGVANNAYRIIEAGDINDAGEIMATAIKCEGGYDSHGHNSFCGGGTQQEEVVAVKLTPIAGADSGDIVTRDIDSEPVERQGAGLGYWVFALAAVLGFRRRTTVRS